MTTAFSRFMQLGYVTNDMAKARSAMADRYGIRDFVEIPGEFACTYRGRSGEVAIAMALANAPGVQIELIVPQSGLHDIYSEPLAGSDDFRILFHHVGVQIEGDHATWLAWLETLHAEGRPPIWTGEVGTEQDFCYCDDRAQLGHYTEYLWWTEKGMMAQPGLIPFNG